MRRCEDLVWHFFLTFWSIPHSTRSNPLTLGIPFSGCLGPVTFHMFYIQNAVIYVSCRDFVFYQVWILAACKRDGGQLTAEDIRHWVDRLVAGAVAGPQVH